MKQLTTSIALALALALPLTRAIAAPDPASLAQAFVAAFDASDKAALEAFVQTHFAGSTLAKEPPSALAQRYITRRSETGPLALRRPDMLTPQGAAFLAESKSHKWYAVQLRFAPGGGAIQELSIDPTLTPPARELHPRRAPELVRAVDAYVGQLGKHGEFSGAVLVTKNDKPLVERASGLASIEYRVANHIDTSFNIGSIGKLFTQVAILQLMQSGKIAPTDTIGKWLPGYPNADAAKNVTVAQLLGMRSGIGDFFGPEFAAAPHGRIRTLQDYLPFFAAKPLAFRPGTDQLYSNGGYIVLGLIVEKASGQSYYDYVSEHVFKPSGMARTGYPEVDDTLTGRATGYTNNGAGLQNAVYGGPARGSSAGGAYSTVHDLAAFASAIRSHALLNEANTNWMLARFPGDAPTEQGPTPTTLGVAGGAPGANAVLLADFRSGETVVVLANLDPPAAEALGRQIRRWSVEAHI